MKTLYIVRHAKASKDMVGIADWQRPLNEAGIDRATLVSKILKRKNIHPDKMISSHAFRALNTAVIFSLNLDYPLNKIEVTLNIYEKPLNNLLELIKNQDNTLASLMIFGHNPFFTELYNYLTGNTLLNLPAASAACVTFDENEWKKIGKGKGKISFLQLDK